MNVLLTIIDAVSDYSGRLFAFLCLPIIAVIMVEVIGRYFFGRPFIWSHEMTTFLTAVLFLMGGAMVLKERSHICVDVLHRLLPVRIRALINVIGSGFFFIYIVVLLHGGSGFALTAIRIAETSGTPWNPPIYVVKVFIPLATALLLLAGIANLIRDFRVLLSGREET
jgi:TRAP-type mannitol/chloroaromatic compound transport system permease small subunit